MVARAAGRNDDLEDGARPKDASLRNPSVSTRWPSTGLAARDIGGKPVPVGVAEMLGNDQVGDRTTGRFLAAIAEHRLGGGVHRQDTAVLVDHDDPVQCRGDDRRLHRLELNAIDHPPFPPSEILTEPGFISALAPLTKTRPRATLLVTIETLFPWRRHRPETALFHKPRIAARSGGSWRSEMTTSRKRSRLRLVLVLAAALGSSWQLWAARLRRSPLNSSGGGRKSLSCRRGTHHQERKPCTTISTSRRSRHFLTPERDRG